MTGLAGQDYKVTSNDLIELGWLSIYKYGYLAAACANLDCGPLLDIEEAPTSFSNKLKKVWEEYSIVICPKCNFIWLWVSDIGWTVLGPQDYL